MEFEASHAVFLDQLARLSHTELAFMWIDADERDQHVRILRRDLQHFVIAVAAEPGLALGVDGEDHRGDLLGSVIGRGFRHGGWMLVG